MKLTGLYRRWRHAPAARAILPLLSALIVGVYPAFYYYTNNAALVRFSSFGRLLPFYALLVLMLYGVSLLVNRGDSVRAATATMVFTLFFNTYGIVYGFMMEIDLVRVEHYTLLPAYIFLGLYSGWLVTRFRKETSFSLWAIVAVVFTLLTLVSIARILPHEIDKYRLSHTPAQVSVNVKVETGTGPDIYYLVFDEFSGLQTMRDYWKNPKVDLFQQQLEDMGFTFLEESRSSDIWSIHQIATRLNSFDYEYVPGHEEKWLNSIANNSAMTYVEARGYTTVMFEEFSWFFPTMPEIRADHIYDISMFETLVTRTLYDDFGMLVMDATMLYPVLHTGRPIYMKYEPLRNFIQYAIEQVPHLEEVSSPKFVYLHLLMPHQPYLYNAEGQPIDPEFYTNWDYYIEYYDYAMTVITDMVARIQAQADPANPPVIILQSDHGARVRPNNRWLRDFPEEYQRDILFALHMPGFDASQLPQDLDPINTLPVVFNHLFDAGIPLQPSTMDGAGGSD